MFPVISVLLFHPAVRINSFAIPHRRFGGITDLFFPSWRFGITALLFHPAVRPHSFVSPPPLAAPKNAKKSKKSSFPGCHQNIVLDLKKAKTDTETHFWTPERPPRGARRPRPATATKKNPAWPGCRDRQTELKKYRIGDLATPHTRLLKMSKIEKLGCHQNTVGDLKMTNPATETHFLGPDRPPRRLISILDPQY